MSGVGSKLKEIRQTKGISLRALAGEIGIHYASLSNIENDKEPCGRETLERIAEALDADADLLLGMAGHRTMPFRVLGNIAAGTPIEATEHIETFDLADHFDPQEHYLLKVRGDSMILDGINSGDLAIMKHASNAKNGQTVVAIVDDGEATLKRYSAKGKTIVLTPANDNLKPVKYGKDQVEVRGVLVGVVRVSVG